MSLFYHQPGIKSPREAPRLPMPQPSSAGGSAASPLMGDAFVHLCRFWAIMREVGCAYHSGGDDDRRQSFAHSGDGVAFAEFKFRELLAWSNGLPADLRLDCQSPQHVQVMQ